MRRFILCSYLSVKYKVTAAQKLETRVNSRPTVVLSNGCKIRLPAPLKLTNIHIVILAISWLGTVTLAFTHFQAIVLRLLAATLYLKLDAGKTCANRCKTLHLSLAYVKSRPSKPTHSNSSTRRWFPCENLTPCKTKNSVLLSMTLLLRVQDRVLEVLDAATMLSSGMTHTHTLLPPSKVDRHSLSSCYSSIGEPLHRT